MRAAGRGKITSASAPRNQNEHKKSRWFLVLYRSYGLGDSHWPIYLLKTFHS